MTIDLTIFTDIGKASKRLFFIRGADLLELFFEPLGDELCSRIGVCAFDCYEVWAFWKKQYSGISAPEKGDTVKILYSWRLKNARNLRGGIISISLLFQAVTAQSR